MNKNRKKKQLLLRKGWFKNKEFKVAQPINFLNNKNEFMPKKI